MPRQVKNKATHCAFCRRERLLTFHHLIPRTTHRNKWFRKNFSKQQMQEGVMLCRDCHKKVHQVHTEKVLGRQFNAPEKLIADPEIAKFVQWVSNR